MIKFKKQIIIFIMKKQILSTLLLLSVLVVFGQVGINTDKPATNAGLHVSERKDPKSTSPDYYNGTILQRYTTSERDKNFTSLTKDHKGLTIYNTTSGCYNVWTWNNTSSSGSWTPLCGEKVGLVDFSDCSTIKVVGKYDTEASVSNQSVRIDIPIKVAELGSYSFTTNEVNGVTFAGQGSFVSLGSQTVSLYPVSATSKPEVGNFNYTITIAPTESAGSTGVSCGEISVSFVNRMTSTLKIVNIPGTENSTGLTESGGNYTTGSSYQIIGSWLTGTAYSGASSAVSYAGVKAIEIVDIQRGSSSTIYGSMAQLQTALAEASIVWVGASEIYSNGFARLISEWSAAGNGIVMLTADKIPESTVCDTLGYYVEDGSSTTGKTKTSNLSDIFTTPFLIEDGTDIGYSGSNAGYISSNNGVKFIDLNGNTGAYADTLNEVFIFGDKFGSTSNSTQRENFTKMLIDIFAWSLKRAPIK